MDKGLKLSLNLEVPKEPEYKPTLLERVEDAMERVEFGSNPEAYHFLRRVNKCLVNCHKAGKRSEMLHKLLGILTPFMSKHGGEDWRGLELIEGYVTNPEYNEDNNED